MRGAIYTLLRGDIAAAALFSRCRFPPRESPVCAQFNERKKSIAGRRGGRESNEGKNQEHERRKKGTGGVSQKQQGTNGKDGRVNAREGRGRRYGHATTLTSAVARDDAFLLSHPTINFQFLPSVAFSRQFIVVLLPFFLPFMPSFISAFRSFCLSCFRPFFHPSFLKSFLPRFFCPLLQRICNDEEADRQGISTVWNCSTA